MPTHVPIALELYHTFTLFDHLLKALITHLAIHVYSDKTTALVIVVIIYLTLAIYIYSIIYIILNRYWFLKKSTLREILAMPDKIVCVVFFFTAYCVKICVRCIFFFFFLFCFYYSYDVKFYVQSDSSLIFYFFILFFIIYFFIPALLRSYGLLFFYIP